MDISKLPLGTLLIWDAEIPFKKWKGYTLEEGKILNTAIITQKNLKIPELGKRIYLGNSKKHVREMGQWMGNSDPHLRKPTKEELEKYEWPQL